MNSIYHWTVDLVIAPHTDAGASNLNVDQYLDKVYQATLAHFPNRHIAFRSSNHFDLFKLKYSEYLR